MSTTAEAPKKTTKKTSARRCVVTLDNYPGDAKFECHAVDESDAERQFIEWSGLTINEEGRPTIGENKFHFAWSKE